MDVNRFGSAGKHCGVQYEMFSFCVLCSVQFAVQCEVCILQRAVCSVQCAVFSLQCSVCSLQCGVCSAES